MSIDLKKKIENGLNEPRRPSWNRHSLPETCYFNVTKDEKTFFTMIIVDTRFFRSRHRKCSAKKVLLKLLRKFHKKTPWNLFLIKLHAVRPKETPTKVLSCEIYQIFKNTYFQEHLQTAASGF